MERLRKYETLTCEQFTENAETELVVERVLQLATQVIIDLATHIAATTSNKRPQNYEEAIELLGDLGVLPSDFANAIKPMAGFRVILVHGYMEIDQSKVFENMHRGLVDFERFAEHLSDWLDKQGLSNPHGDKP